MRAIGLAPAFALARAPAPATTTASALATALALALATATALAYTLATVTALALALALSLAAKCRVVRHDAERGHLRAHARHHLLPTLPVESQNLTARLPQKIEHLRRDYPEAGRVSQIRRDSPRFAAQIDTFALSTLQPPT